MLSLPPSTTTLPVSPPQDQNAMPMPMFIMADGSSLEVGVLAERLGPLPPGVDLVDHAVNTMGLVWFDRGESGYRVRLKPRSITPETEAALYFALLAGPAKPVFVAQSRENAFAHKFYTSNIAAVSAISSLIESARRERRSRFRQRSTHLEALAAHPSLQHLLDDYRMNSGACNLASLRELLPVATEGRYLLVERRGHSNVLLIRNIGSGNDAFDTRWLVRSDGLRLEEHPDAEYGAWLTASYLPAMQACSPHTDEVDATVYKPALGRSRHTYRRLMLPYMWCDDRQFLLSAWVPDTSVDLRDHETFDAG
jgi:hypothetical protein